MRIFTYHKYFSELEVRGALLSKGYKFTNIRKIAVDHLGYKSAKDILTAHPKISPNVLYFPLVYRREQDLSNIIQLVEDLFNSIDNHFVYGNRRLGMYILSGPYDKEVIDGVEVYYRSFSLDDFRYDRVISRLIDFNIEEFGIKRRKYEHPYYIP